jgi:hypothetical protein
MSRQKPHTFLVETSPELHAAMKKVLTDPRDLVRWSLAEKAEAACALFLILAGQVTTEDLGGLITRSRAILLVKSLLQEEGNV